MYDPETKMVNDARLFSLNVNYYYNYNMKSVDLSDQLRTVYRFYHWMRKYKRWWSLFFWCHDLVIFNDYTIYKILCEEGKVNPMSNYYIWRLVCLAKIDLKTFGVQDHLVSAGQRRGIIKKSMYLHLLWLFQHGLG